MMDMRERIARAIHDECEGVTGPNDDSGGGHYMRAADRVLEAMRVPTRAMVEAAKPEPTHLYGKGGRDEFYERQMKVAVQVDRMAATSFWQAMIDEARLPK